MHDAVDVPDVRCVAPDGVLAEPRHHVHVAVDDGVLLGLAVGRLARMAPQLSAAGAEQTAAAAATSMIFAVVLIVHNLSGNGPHEVPGADGGARMGLFQGRGWVLHEHGGRVYVGRG